eukprot:SAG22_NODE_2942_length_2087_cov_11.860161_2_plen_487_part_00
MAESGEPLLAVECPATEAVHAGVECRLIPGKHRGLVAAAALPAGSLVLRAAGLFIPAVRTDAARPMADLQFAALLQQLSARAAADPAAAERLLRRSQRLVPVPVEPADRAAFVAKQQQPEPDSEGGTRGSDGAESDPVTAYVGMLQAELEAADGASAAVSLPPCGLADGTAVLDFFVRMDRNTFDGGFCPSIALLNHACRPNCVAALSCVDEAAASISLEVRTLEAVAAGAELTISYLDGVTTYHPAAARQLALAHWGFECSCTRCLVAAGKGGAAEGSAVETAELALLETRGDSAAAEAAVAGALGALEQQPAVAAANGGGGGQAELGHQEADRLADAYAACAAALGPRHWVLSRLNDRLAKAYRRAAIEFRAADGFLDTPEGAAAFATCLRAHLAHTREVVAAVAALSPPTDKPAVAAAGRLTAALKTIAADPESFGPEEVTRAAGEAVVVEREALRVVAAYYGQSAASDPLGYLGGLADASAL